MFFPNKNQVLGAAQDCLSSILTKFSVEETEETEPQPVIKPLEDEVTEDKVAQKPFSYTETQATWCKEIVISQRAYLSILAEALSHDPLETGGILFGHWEHGTWYVVEATDPGIKTIHTINHHEMDDDYYNHLYPVLSRLYKHKLTLVGLWHRHPGSMDRFSADDNRTNEAFAKAIGNGTLSLLLNFDPIERLSCYYLDQEEGNVYHKLPLRIGDAHFHGTEFLSLTTEALLKCKS